MMPTTRRDAAIAELRACLAAPPEVAPKGAAAPVRAVLRRLVQRKPRRQRQQQLARVVA